MILQIKVKLHSNNPRLEKIANNKYLAYLKSPPEKGKANLELIKLLSKEFSIPPKKIRIKTLLSQNKVVEILA
ncbi:MAG: DUF167 domain-containing protein [Nanoarchaeota archaeon]|nr:DUF167 domain-containing protein [Nanoarchaeota archaeon]MBU1051138.1 DUF167 domain-containing protein [Nanoarchaeota archaeon]MBU1988530.1 DUF167 domain-containing protein [Nanoarchaeota archaeon]